MLIFLLYLTYFGVMFPAMTATWYWYLQGKKAKQHLDWAESLLCNAVPMSHCSQEDWNKAVRQWRDKKHSL